MFFACGEVPGTLMADTLKTSLCANRLFPTARLSANRVPGTSYGSPWSQVNSVLQLRGFGSEFRDAVPIAGRDRFLVEQPAAADAGDGRQGKVIRRGGS